MRQGPGGRCWEASPVPSKSHSPSASGVTSGVRENQTSATISSRLQSFPHHCYLPPCAVQGTEDGVIN